MNLNEAYTFCFKSRETWAHGKGAATARINAEHVLRVLGNIDIADISSATFAKLTRQLISEGKSKSTVNRITATLSTLLTELRQNGVEAPKVEFKRQREPKGRPGYYTEEEMDALLRAAAKRRDGLLLHDSILFAYKTGCRQSEMLRLTEDDIDFENRTILFRDTKNGEDHLMRMHEDLIPALQRRLSSQNSCEFVFDWLNKDELLRVFKTTKVLAGLPVDDRVWHTIRHTVATLLCEKQVPIRTVMGVLNHKSIDTTLRYAKATDRSVSSAIDML